MTLNSIILIFFLTSLITSGFMVLLLPNPIHSLLFLIIVFVNTSGILMSFNLDFLALLLIIIYVGAIAVLFLFMLMMLDIKFTSMFRKDWLVYSVFGTLIGLLLFVETFSAVFNNFVVTNMNLSSWIDNVVFISNCETFGHNLYSYNILLILIAGLILLLALLGAVVLTHIPNRINNEKDFIQLSRNSLLYLIKKK